MATFFPHRSFTEKDKKIFFHRQKRGPTYEVTWAEREQITSLMHRLHFLMATVVFGFALVLAVVIVFLPIILDMSFGIALVLLLLMGMASLAPFLLMVKFHLDFQKDVRKILGDRLAVEFSFPKAPPQTRAEAKRENFLRFVVVFLLGTAITALGLTMLFGSDFLPFRMKLIWTMDLITGLGLLIVGFIGLALRYKD